MNLELAEKIVVLLGEYPVSEITVETQEGRVHVVKPLGSVLPTPAVQAAPSANVHDESEALAVPAAPELIPLPSPMVGVFYHLEPPLSFAAEVKPGQVVGFIESMKLMNDVVAERGGRITDILIEDGAPVEYGQTLFRLAVL